MRAATSISLAMMVTGCAVPTSGVMPLSDGLVKVTHQGNGAWVTTASLKTAAIGEANEHCMRTGKQARVIDVKEAQARPFGGWPEAEVLFRCEAAR